MKLGYDLTLEQSQKLIMTPELRQAIQMLQYTSLELNNYIKQEMEVNPLLEWEKPAEGVQEVAETEIKLDETEIDWKEYLEKYDDISYKVEVDKNKKDYSFENYTSYGETLKDYLIEQLNMINIDASDYKTGEYIIQNIDNNGYLIATVEEMAEQLKHSAEEIETILSVIQAFEPYGVGARNLKECLLIQLKDEKNYKIKQIVEDHLEDIAQNKIAVISKALGISNIKTQEYIDIIKSLEPKPGRSFKGSEDVKYIIPDATIEEINGEFYIFINDITGPRLNINEYYRNLLKTTKDQKTTEYLESKFNSAMWIIKSIEQRRQTMYKVIESILKYQKDFFLYGEKRLNPLTLKDVAEDIEMHESTISRATSGKYVQTPRGLFELKYFFTAGLSARIGEISTTSVKSIIKGIIKDENPKKPLSDQVITDMLKAREIIISRRTVAKYREELNIPSSSMRRRF